MMETEDIRRIRGERQVGREFGRREACRRARQARTERLIQRIADVAPVVGLLGIVGAVGWVNGWW